MLKGQTMIKKDRRQAVAELFRKALRTAPEFKSYAEPSTMDLTIVQEETARNGGMDTSKGPKPGEFIITCTGKKS